MLLSRRFPRHNETLDFPAIGLQLLLEHQRYPAAGHKHFQIAQAHQTCSQFRRCKDISDLSALGVCLGKLTMLESLELTFSGCYSLMNSSELWRGLARMCPRSFRHLKLDFSGVKLGIKNLSDVIRNLMFLKTLEISLRSCLTLEDKHVVQLLANVVNHHAVDALALDFRSCSALSSQLSVRFEDTSSISQAIAFMLDEKSDTFGTA